MPGPKMGPRPADFDEALIRQSPTFMKWMQLETGQKLKYACRDFVKGNGDDEERLMRRIMIARRNNIRDHETLKKARKQQRSLQQQQVQHRSGCTVEEPKRGRAVSSYSDDQIEKEMDEPAVMATRSYRTWAALPTGQEFVVRTGIVVRHCKVI